MKIENSEAHPVKYPWYHGVLRCAKIRYRTHTCVTHFENTVGFPILMPSPKYPTTEVSSNGFEPMTQGQNRELNLPQKREPEPDQTSASLKWNTQNLSKGGSIIVWIIGEQAPQ